MFFIIGVFPRQVHVIIKGLLLLGYYIPVFNPCTTAWKWRQ